MSAPPLHITLLFPAGARPAQPRGDLLRLLGTTLRARDPRQQPALAPPALGRLPEALCPGEQELYTKDERLLRGDAVRHAMDCSQLIVIALSEEYQSCPLLAKKPSTPSLCLNSATRRCSCAHSHTTAPSTTKTRGRGLLSTAGRASGQQGQHAHKGRAQQNAYRHQAAQALLPNDPRLAPDARLCSTISCRPRGRIARSRATACVLTNGATWFALWSEKEAELLSAYMLAHS